MAFWYIGTAIETRITTIAITIMSSIMVNPD
jgi:hypothetical protein